MAPRTQIVIIICNAFNAWHLKTQCKGEKQQQNGPFTQYFQWVKKKFKALWAGLTNQRDILDFFTVTPLIDYLVDPSRSLEHYINMHQVHTQLALACLDAMQAFPLKPTSRISCGMFFQNFLFTTLTLMQLLGGMPYFSGMITLWGQDLLRTSY